MPTYPLPTLAPTIDSTGISAPQYSDIYQSLIATFQNIFGSDIVVTPDSQDGQFIAAIAQAISDSNQATVAIFTAFSPTYAQGAALSAQVKINGIARKVATNSTVNVTIGGQVGTVIANGIVQDINQNLWNLPATVTIPAGGSITVTATAQQVGAISAAIGTVTTIYNPQLGWQSVTNATAATAGAPVETDAALRIRQTQSVALPALTVMEAIYAAIGAVAGVTRFALYENATGTTDSNGIPAHSISAVVQGGAIADIGTAIYSRKPPGIQTYGTTTSTQTDAYGLTVPINFYVLQTVSIYYSITIKALPGYVSTTGNALIAALVAFTNALAIGEDVYTTQAQAVASLINSPLGQTFYITAFTLGTAPAPGGTSNIAIAFNQAAICATGNVVLTTT